MSRKKRIVFAIGLSVILLLLSGFHTGAAGYDLVISVTQAQTQTNSVDRWFADLIAFGFGMLVLCVIGLLALLAAVVLMGGHED